MRYHYTTSDSYALGGTFAAEGDVCIIDELEDDEPIFVLRAKDAAALATLNLYRSMTEGMFETAKAEELERIVDRFIAWRLGHRALLKDPD